MKDEAVPFVECCCVKLVSTQSCFMELIYRQQFMNVTLKSYVSLEIE